MQRHKDPLTPKQAGLIRGKIALLKVLGSIEEKEEKLLEDMIFHGAIDKYSCSNLIEILCLLVISARENKDSFLDSRKMEYQIDRAKLTNFLQSYASKT